MRFLSFPLIFLSIALSLALVPEVAVMVAHSWKTYIPLLAGVLLYIILGFIPFMSKNSDHIRTLSHEFSHWIVSIFFFHKIHAFNVQGGSGYISHSGRFGDIFIGLAPYCVPVFTIFILLLRSLIIPEALMYFDVAAGLTLAFHIACFAGDIGTHQTDITGRGVFKSYAFIFAAWMFFAMLIALSLKHDIFWGVKYIFVGYWDSICDFFRMIFA